MLRGFTKFQCPNCGHVFEAPDIEDNATASTMPQPCPRCGTKSSARGLHGTYIDILVALGNLSKKGS